jgi:PhnB protein
LGEILSHRPAGLFKKASSHMELSPYLTFDGRCAEAFRFYEQCLSGRIEMMQTHVESPMKDQEPADWREEVLHARLAVGRSALMGCDAPPDRFTASQGMTVAISVPPADVERIFKALADGGRITMPFETTFWSPGCGRLVDRFGTPWLVNTDEHG